MQRFAASLRTSSRPRPPSTACRSPTRPGHRPHPDRTSASTAGSRWPAASSEAPRIGGSPSAAGVRRFPHRGTTAGLRTTGVVDKHDVEDNLPRIYKEVTGRRDKRFPPALREAVEERLVTHSMHPPCQRKHAARRERVRQGVGPAEPMPASGSLSFGVKASRTALVVRE